MAWTASKVFMAYIEDIIENTTAMDLNTDASIKVALYDNDITPDSTVTSANMSGGAESLSDEEARGVFGDRVAVYIEGRSPGGGSSTVVDVTGSEVVVLRRGPVVL